MRERIWILLGKRVSGEISEDELAELEQLLRNVGDATFSGELMERLWQTPLVTQERSGEENWAAISAAIQERETRVVPVGRRWLWAAASVALLLLAGGGGYWWALHPVRDVSANVVATRPDSRSKVNLPDGTTVWLNSDSRITYHNNFGQTSRDIDLEGEAFFDAAHDPGLPLVVHAKGMDIQVLGTSFNVRAYPQDSQVVTSVISGEVALTTKTRPGWRLILRARQKALMSPHQRRQNIDTLHEEPRSQTIPEVSWVSGKLVFYKEPFRDVAQKMERWYRVHLQIEDKTLEEVTLTGVFDKESLTQALTALQVSCHFHYALHEDTVIIRP